MKFITPIMRLLLSLILMYIAYIEKSLFWLCLVILDIMLKFNFSFISEESPNKTTADILNDDADREMIGNDVSFFDGDIGNK